MVQHPTLPDKVLCMASFGISVRYPWRATTLREPQGTYLVRSRTMYTLCSRDAKVLHNRMDCLSNVKRSRRVRKCCHISNTTSHSTPSCKPELLNLLNITNRPCAWPCTTLGSAWKPLPDTFEIPLLTPGPRDGSQTCPLTWYDITYFSNLQCAHLYVIRRIRTYISWAS